MKVNRKRISSIETGRLGSPAPGGVIPNAVLPAGWGIPTCNPYFRSPHGRGAFVSLIDEGNVLRGVIRTHRPRLEGNEVADCRCSCGAFRTTGTKNGKPLPRMYNGNAHDGSSLPMITENRCGVWAFPRPRWNQRKGGSSASERSTSVLRLAQTLRFDVLNGRDRREFQNIG